MLFPPSRWCPLLLLRHLLSVSGYIFFGSCFWWTSRKTSYLFRPEISWEHRPGEFLPWYDTGVVYIWSVVVSSSSAHILDPALASHWITSRLALYNALETSVALQNVPVAKCTPVTKVPQIANKSLQHVPRVDVCNGGRCVCVGGGLFNGGTFCDFTVSYLGHHWVYFYLLGVWSFCVWCHEYDESTHAEYPLHTLRLPHYRS